jgi:cell division protein FtsI (penicillin-binding protein 3)
MLVVGALTLSCLAARLVQVQGVDGAHYASYGSQEIYQRVTLPALRGAVYDRSGNLLAASSSRVDVVADDYLVTAGKTGLGRLASIHGMSRTRLNAKLSQHSGYVPLAYQVDSTVEHEVESLDLSYINLVPDTVRADTDGELFSPILGIVGFGGRALSGLEYMENSLLSGKAGSEVIPTGLTGEALPGSAKDVVAAHQGASLVLTLDEPLQFEATKDLSRQMIATHAASGVVIVEDRRNGDILAMVDLVNKNGKVVPRSHLCVPTRLGNEAGDHLGGLAGGADLAELGVHRSLPNRAGRLAVLRR